MKNAVDRAGIAPHKLGSCGIETFPLGAGCWAIGGPATNLGLPMGWSTASDSLSMQGLVRAFELGIRLFDTADVYGHGHSERLLGQLLCEVPRAETVVVSKVGYFAGTSRSAYEPLHMRHQLEQTLENLQTDYLDIYFFHNSQFGPADRDLAAAVEQMRAFRSQGLIRAIGMRGPHRFALDRFSIPKDKRTDKHRRFREVFNVIKPDVLAVRYNMLTPDRPEDIFEWASRHGTGILINKPLGQGLLTGKYNPKRPPTFGDADHRSRKRWFTADPLSIIDECLEPVRRRFGSSPRELVRVALRYCLQRADNVVVLVGFTTPTQIEMNLTCLGEPLSAEDLVFVRSSMITLRNRLLATGGVFLDDHSTVADDSLT